VNGHIVDPLYKYLIKSSKGGLFEDNIK